jgi:hypothetical protein
VSAICDFVAYLFRHWAERAPNHIFTAFRGFVAWGEVSYRIFVVVPLAKRIRKEEGQKVKRMAVILQPTVTPRATESLNGKESESTMRLLGSLSQ